MGFYKKQIPVWLSVLLFSTVLPIPLISSTAHAATVVATITKAQGNSNSAYLEFSVPLADSDVLFKTGFESGEKQLNLNWHGIGNQSYVTGGNNSATALQLLDNITTRKGNYYDSLGGEVNGTYSMAQYGIPSVKSDSRLSLQYDLKTTGSINNVLSFFGSLWKSKGVFSKDDSGRELKFKDTVTFTSSSAPTKYYVKTDEGPINIPNGRIYTFISSSYDDYRWGFLYYVYNSNDQSFNLRTDVMTQPSGVAIGGSSFVSTREGQTFVAGSNVIEIANYPDISVYKEQNNTTNWSTYNSSFDLPTSAYSSEKYGAQFYTRWQTNGSVLLDNIKIGYAEKAILYRDGNQVYTGYDSNFTDTGATDRTPPAELDVGSLHYTYNKSNKQVNVGWSAPVDNGTNYTYTVQGQLRDGTLGNPQDPKVVTVTSGIKGYIVTSDNVFTTVINSGAISTTSTEYTFTPTQGNHYVHIAPVDNNGNIGETQTLNLVDGDSPIVTLTPSTVQATNKEVVVSVNAIDNTTWITNVALPNGVQIDSGSTSFVVNENGTYAVTATDFFGNVKTSSITVSNIDKTPPVITMTPNTVIWQPNDITIDLLMKDDYPLMGSTLKHKVSSSSVFPDANDKWIVSDTTSRRIVLSKIMEGQFYVHAQAMDAAGNITVKTSGVYQIKSLPKALNGSDVTITSPSSSQLHIALPVSDVMYRVFINNMTYVIPKGSGDLDITLLNGGTDYPITITPTNESGDGLPFTTVGTTRPDAASIESVIPVIGEDGPMRITIKSLHGVDRYEYIIMDSNGSIVKTLSTVDVSPVFDLLSNTKYTVTIKGFNHAGVGLPSTRTFLTVPTVIGLSVTDIHEQSLQLSWATVTGDSYYDIMRDNIPLTTVTNATYTFNDQEIAGIKNGVSYYIDQGLDANRSYFYNIKASNDAGSSNQYNITAKTLPAIPDVTVSQVSSTGFLARFKPLDGVTYDIFRNGILLTSVHDYYEFTNLDSGIFYTYEIVARNSSGSGLPFRLSVLTKPATPEHLVISDYMPTSATLQFDTLVGVDRYVVSIDGQILSSSNPRFELSHLLPGHSYTATVYAVNEAGVSSKQSVIFHTLPDVVIPSITDVNEESIMLEWSDVEGVIGYEIDTPNGTLRTTKQDMVLPSPGAGVYAEYGVRTIGASGVNLNTQWVSVVGAPVRKDDTTMGLQVSQITATTARLYWSEFSGAVGYRLYDGDHLIATTTDTVFDLSGLTSSTTYDHYMVQAVSGGDTRSRKYGTTFETLSVNTFMSGVRNITRTEAELYVTNVPVTDTIVVKRFENNVFSDVYEGSSLSIPLLSLRNDTYYTYYIYTRNHGSVLSDPQIITFKTKEPQQPNEPVPSMMPIINPNGPTKTTDTLPNDSTPQSTVPESDSPLHFIDVGGRFSENAIYALAAKGILNGYDDGTFKPKANVTRAEFIKMLDTAGYLQPSKNTAVMETMTFPDVPTDAWYADSIQKASSFGIVNGYLDGLFKPDQTLTRAEVAKILAKVGVTSINKASFSDESALPDWAKSEIEQVGGAGIFIGYDSGKFLPKKTITREESALVVYRLLDK